MSEQELEGGRVELSEDEAQAALKELGDFVELWANKYAGAVYASYGVPVGRSHKLQLSIATCDCPVKLGYAVVMQPGVKEKEYLRDVLLGTYAEGQIPDKYRDAQRDLLNLLVGTEDEIKGR